MSWHLLNYDKNCYNSSIIDFIVNVDRGNGWCSVQEKVRAYSKCEFHTVVNPKIQFSAEELQGEIMEGENLQGSFVIASENERPITGNVEVFDHRIRMTEGAFATTSYTVSFEVTAKGMKAGETIIGAFHILTNGGEYDLPYQYQVVPRYMLCGQRKISDLKEFAKLASENYEEALHLFSHKDFISLLCQGPLLANYRRIYESLRKSSSVSQAMDEFLITAGEKERVLLKPKRQAISVVYQKEDVAKDVVIKKEGFGYVDAQISCRYSCVFIGKTVLSKDDFVGNEAVIPIVISIDQLPAKQCQIPLIINTAYETFEIELQIRPKKSSAKERTPLEMMFSPMHLKKTYQKQLLTDYLNYRSGKMTLQEYTRQSIECCNELMKFDLNHHWYRLLRLHMYIMRKEPVRIEQEIETIDKYRERMLGDVVGSCYYVYLLALYKKDRDVIKAAVRQIRDSYVTHPKEFLLFFMMMYLDEDYVEEKELIYQDFSRLYERGCNSPMLYYEACELYNEYPNMIRDITEFDLTALYWGFRKGCLNEEVRNRFIAIVPGVTVYHEKVFKILRLLYEQKPQEELLEAICRILMKGRKVESRYHRYYALGVEHSLRLLGLMECYMKSLPKDGYPVLPKQVVLYFTHEERRLSEEQLSYLYANVLVNRQEYGSSFEEYKEAIERFLCKQVEMGTVSDHLIVLYREFLKEPSLLAAVSKYLPNVLFKQRLECDNPNMEWVLVNYDESDQTGKVLLKDGVAYVDQVTEHVNITLSDRKNRRYMGSVPFTLYPVMEDEELLPYCYEADPANFAVLLRLAHYAKQAGTVDYETIKVYKTLLEKEEISEEYRKQLNAAVLQYYYEQYEGDIFEDYLLKIDLKTLDEDNRNLAISYMIDRELYEMAMAAVATYGYDGLALSYVKSLCNAFVEQEEISYDELLVTMAYELFYAGEYSEAVLKYLIRFAKGGNRELIAIYKAAEKLHFDTLNLEERIVHQAILSDEYDANVTKAFVSYTKKQPNRFVMEAYLNIMAYRYFIEGEAVPKKMTELWTRAFEEGHFSHPLCLAAMLHAISREEKDRLKFQTVIQSAMQQLAAKDMVFPFMKAFQGVTELPKELYLKTYLLYRGEPGHQVYVHYYRKGPKRPQAYSERMREYFDGYYVKDFVLFDDEELAYYVTDEDDGETKRIESSKLPLETHLQGINESRFAMINELIKAEKEEQEEFYEKVKRYQKNVYLIDHNMTPL